MLVRWWRASAVFIVFADIFSEGLQFTTPQVDVLNVNAGHVVNRTGRGRRVAILLVGAPRNYDQWHFIEQFKQNLVEPNGADVFIQADAVPDALLAGLGACVKASRGQARTENRTNAPAGTPQFEDFKRAFSLMGEYERAQGFKYDIVVKARTEVVPVSGAQLDLAGAELSGRIRMMTDMIFWGWRDDMAKVAGFYDAIKTYYHDEHPDSFHRPINVHKLLESFERDPRLMHVEHSDITWETLSQEYLDLGWELFNKLEQLPYPDMDKVGAVWNLKAAAAKGLSECAGDSHCPIRCGDRYVFMGAAAGQPVLAYINPRLPCTQSANSFIHDYEDYKFGELRVEMDLLHWVMHNDLIVCDVGATMHTINYKGTEISRVGTQDCQ